MRIKKLVRLFLGNAGYQFIRETALFVRDMLKRLNNNIIDCGSVRFSANGEQVFFGYYDLQQFNNCETRLLAHVVKRNAHPNKDEAKVGYFDISSPACFHQVAVTRAWCWQQGARLRWGEDSEKTIWFNDFEKGQYVCKCVDIVDGSLVKHVPYPLYDIDQKMKYGVTLDYERLQRYRPGYGYSRLSQCDDADDLNIGYVDIENGTKTDIVSMYDCVNSEEWSKYIPYFNHLSFSPQGDRFLFFVVLKEKLSDKWKVKLFVKDLITNNLILLENEERASHYAWKNNNEVLVTLMDNDRHEHYCIYDIKMKTKTEVGTNILVNDGHPNFCCGGESFISDTYPLGDNHQKLFCYSAEKGKQQIGSIYHDPRGRDDKRCDLHPRLSYSNKMIALDCLNKKDQRSILVLKTEVK